MFAPRMARAQVGGVAGLRHAGAHRAAEPARRPRTL